jgi:hypothetical protein
MGVPLTLPEALCVHNTPLRANLPVSVRTRLTKVGVLLVQWQGRCPQSRIGGDRLAAGRQNDNPHPLSRAESIRTSEEKNRARRLGGHRSAAQVAAFDQGLKETGYVEGQNVAAFRRFIILDFFLGQKADTVSGLIGRRAQPHAGVSARQKQISRR